MATTIGPFRPDPKGAYSALTEYSLLDWVTDSGNSYLYINETPSTGTALSTGTHWLCILDPTDAVQDALADYTTVAGSGAGSDTYACDVNDLKAVNFALTIAGTDAKVITFSNVPTGRCEVFLEITTSAVGSVTWTLDGGTLAWANGSAPTLATGKIYRILFITNDSGATWDAYASWGV